MEYSSNQFDEYSYTKAFRILMSCIAVYQYHTEITDDSSSVGN